MRCKSILVLAAAFPMVAGCTHIDPVTQSPDPQFGEALRYDMAAQTINPDPVYPEDAAEPGSLGDKGAAAIQRYRKDQVKDRHKAESETGKSGSLSTTQSTSGSGGPK